MAVSFFYDEQIRRFLLQFTRMFSGFQVEYGRDDNGNVTYLTVPVRYADASRQAQTIIQNNSANSFPCAPQITFYISGMDYARDRVQEPHFVDRKYIKQRTYDDSTQSYEETQGNAFTVERIMPVPYNMQLTVDIWTTNINQKLQMFEQISTMFNPSLEIQSTDNYLDWTSLSVVELNRVNFQSKSIPIGTDEPIDFLTYEFTLPIWITPPARVTKGGIIHKVIANIFDAKGDLHNAIYQDDLLLGTRLKVTPHGYKILLIGNELQVLPHNAISDPADSIERLEWNPDNVLHWHPIVDEYGTLRDGITQIRLENYETNQEIIGTVSYHPTDKNKLIYTVDIDTLPANTLDPINAIIDPLRSAPDIGLPAEAVGQRYLLTDEIGSASDSEMAPAWSGASNTELIAQANDIIEYNGSEWVVAFRGNDDNRGNYVTNLTTTHQYKWTGMEWLRSYEGIYPGGEWSLVI
jgi:hypothetical protein